jgi:hypothetical protein
MKIAEPNDDSRPMTTPLTADPCVYTASCCCDGEIESMPCGGSYGLSRFAEVGIESVDGVSGDGGSKSDGPRGLLRNRRVDMLGCWRELCSCVYALLTAKSLAALLSESKD